MLIPLQRQHSGTTIPRSLRIGVVVFEHPTWFQKIGGQYRNRMGCGFVGSKYGLCNMIKHDATGCPYSWEKIRGQRQDYDDLRRLAGCVYDASIGTEGSKTVDTSMAQGK